MGAAASWIVPSVIGGLGLLQSGQAQSAQNRYISGALGAMRPQEAAQNAILQLAQGYNPAAEDARAISSANQNAQSVLGNTLDNMAGQFRAGGGSPGGSSEFAVGATNASNRVLDPLREFAANLASTETQRKAGMYNSVFAAPAGQIANTYFNAAAANQPNWGPSLQMFGNALMKIPGWGGMAAGSDPFAGATASGTAI